MALYYVALMYSVCMYVCIIIASNYTKAVLILRKLIVVTIYDIDE